MPLDIFNDKEFQSLDYDKKQKIATNYFNKEMADDSFKKLDSARQEKIITRFLADNVGNKPQPERNWEEVARDFPMQIGAGVGSLVETAGDTYGLISGNMDNKVSKMGKTIGSTFKKEYSQPLKDMEKSSQAEIDKETGEWNKFVKTVENTATNPALASKTIVESIPMLLASGGVGRAAKIITNSAKAGTWGAVGTGGVLQGSDMGSETYDTLMKLDDNYWSNIPEFQEAVKRGVNPQDAKNEISLGISRVVAGASGALSIGANKFISGGDVVENVLTGNSIGAGMLKSGLKGAVGEGATESLEEGGGKTFQNIGVQQVNPNQPTFQGVGQATGTGLVAGGFTGGVAGTVGGATNVQPQQQKVGQPQEQPKQKTADEILATPMKDLVAEIKQSKVFGDTKAKSEAMAVDVGDINYEQMAQENQPQSIESSSSELPNNQLEDNPVVKENLTTEQPQVDVVPQTPDYANTLWDDAYLEKLNNMEQQAKEAGNNKAVFEIAKDKAKVEELLFSKKQEDTKDLIVQHNLSEANLKYARKGNGLTVPSLAITKGENPLTGFGEITLLGDKDLANPKGYAKTKVFGADIYSPRYPREKREYKSSDIRKMDKELEKYSIALQDGSINRDDDVSDLVNNKAMQLKFLNEVKGINPEIPTKKNPNEEIISRFYPDEYNYSIQNKGIDLTSLYKDENFKQKVVADLKAKFTERGKDLDPIAAYGEDGINNIARERAQTIDQIGRSQGKPDFYAMREILRNEIAKYNNEFSDYVDNFKNKYDYKSFFYDDGKKKKFDENTILKYLTSNLRGGENFNYGTGNIRAIITPEYKTIEQIKKAKDKLVSSEEFEPIKDSLNNQLLEIVASIAAKGGNQFMANDIAMEFIQDYAKRGKRAINDYDVNVNDESLKKVNEFLDLLKEMPTEYFEAKITRNVQPSEFRAAVVPDSISQDTLDYLNKQGLKIKTYKSGDEVDRKRAIQEATKENDLLFSQFKTKNSTTVSEAINQTKKLLGKKFDEVTKNVEFVQSANELPTFIKKQLGANEDNVVKSGGIPRGIFDPQDNKIYLIADSMKSNEVQGVVLHELLHRAINGMVKDGQSRLETILGSKLNPLVDRMNKLASQGDKTVLEAIKRVKDAGVPKANQTEEMMTYLLENVTNDKNASPALIRWVKDTIQAIKDFIRKVAVSLGIEPNWFISRMNPQDIASVLRSVAIDGKDAIANDSIMFSKDKSRLMEWHKDSSPETKNEDGTPKVFYHGTNADFDTFDKSKIGSRLNADDKGFFFTEDTYLANDYGYYGNVMPVYLKIKKPLSSKNIGEFYGVDNIDEILEQYGYSDDLMGWADNNKDRLNKIVEDNGYDGIVLNTNNGQSLAVVFEPTQIKSVNNKGTFDESNPNIMYSKEAVKDREQTKLDTIKKWVSDKAYDVKSTNGMSALLYVTTRQQKTDMFKDIAPELQTYDDLVEAKIAEANKIAKISGDIAEKTRKWAVKNKAEADKLFKFMGETTIDGIDPTKTFEEQKKKAERFYAYADKIGIEYDKKDREKLSEERYNFVKAKYNALPNEAKEIYSTMKEHYERLADKMFIALKNKVAEAELDENVKTKLIDKLRVEFESRKVAGPYFPLMRFGEYVVTGKNKDGEPVVERYETPSERNNRATEMEQEGYSDIKKTADVNKNVNLQADTAFMSEVLKQIEEVNPLAFESISEDVYQLYLKYLPNMSARKAFIHRKGIKGYSDDMLRTFAAKTFHLGRQIANINYLDKMQREIDRLEKRVKETGDPKLKVIYEDLLKTHDHIINPEFNQLAQHLTSLGFFWYMTSLSAGILNLSQVALVVFPKLSGKYGATKTFYELSKSASQISLMGVNFLGDKLNIDKKFDISKFLKDDEIKFLEEMKDSGIIDLTMTHDLAGLGDHYNDIKYGPLTTAKRVLSVPQHYSEVFNRMVTLLTAYRLAKSNKVENPTKEAIAINYETNFNYTNENRNRLMRNPIAKVVTQFKNYSVQMLYFMLKHSFKALKGDKEALKTMGTLMFVGAALSGVKGMPLQALYAMAGLGGVDDPEDELYKNIKEVFGEYTDLVWRGVVNYITGADIGGRTGLSDMLLKSPTREMNTKDTINHYTTQILGPSLSIFTNFALGISDIARGEAQRGIEKTMPKPIKDILQSIRFGQEGARDNDFKPIVEEFSPYELAVKTVGFQPESLAKQQESNMRVLRVKARIDNERSEILKNLRKANVKDNKELWQETMKKIQEFNDKYPSLAIKNDTIRRSLLGDEKDRAKSVNGLNIAPKYEIETQGYK